MEVVSFTVNEHARAEISIPEYVSIVDINNAVKDFSSVRNIGNNNLLLIGKEIDTKGFALSVKGNNNNIILGSRSVLRGNISIGGNNITVFIGSNTTFDKVGIFCKGNNHGVYIGKDCMFSSGIEIRTSDSHSVIDLEKMEKTNHPDGVYIGDHVWIGKNAFIQKGSFINDDNIVGFGAFINGVFHDSHTKIVGTPAKAIKKSKVTWSRKGNPIIDESIYDWKLLSLL